MAAFNSGFNKLGFLGLQIENFLNPQNIVQHLKQENK